MSALTPRPSTVVRDFMLWLFDVPHGEPYISATVDITWEPALAYLERVNRDPGPDAPPGGGGPRVTTHHLFVAAVGRLFTEFPEINARVFGRTIYGLPSVDVVMPVNLLGSELGRELSMVIVKGVEKLSPREVARATRPQVDAERNGTGANAVVKTLLGAGAKSPSALRIALRTVAMLAHDPRATQVLAREFPVSTLVTNVGAALGKADGVRFRAVALSPPSKLVHLGSLFGLGPLDRVPVAVGDEVKVATVLPVAFVFDHRLVDGVMAGRILARLGAILQDPAAIWPE